MALRYWVGGTANWDGTAGTKWALTSGGAGGQAVPTSADDVFFDGSSGANTVTITATANAKSVTCTGFTGTLAGTSALNVAGSVTFVAGMTLSYTGNMTITATGTVTSGGKSMPPLIVNGSGITVTQGDAFTFASVSGATYLTLTQGTYTTNNNNITISGTTGTGINISGTSTRTLTLGSSSVSITFSGSAPTFFNATTVTNLTFNANTSTITCVHNGTNNASFIGGGRTFSSVVLTNSTTGAATTITSFTPYAIAVTGANTFTNLTFSGRTSGGYGTYTFAANQTISGTLTASAGTDASMRSFIRSDTVGTARTLTCAAVSLTDADFQDITMAGAAAPVSGTRLGNCTGNTSITFPGAKTIYWNLAGTQNINATGWATSSGGSPATTNFPLAQDTAVFDNTGSAGTVTVNGQYNFGTIDMSARTSAMTLSIGTNNSASMFADWKNGSGTTFSGQGVTIFKGTSNSNITSSGKTFTPDIFIEKLSASVILQDAFTGSSSQNTVCCVNTGTLNLNGFTFTIGTFRSSNSNTRTLAFGTGNITVVRGGGSWDTGTVTNLTVTGTPVVNYSLAIEGASTIDPGPLSETNSISFNITSGTYSLSFLRLAGHTARNIDFTGFAGTWAATSTGTIYGDLKLSTGMTLTASSSAMTFGATSGTKTITSNGKTILFDVTINGAGATYTLFDNFALGTNQSFTLTAGTLTLSNNTLTTQYFSSSNSNTRVINFGTGKIVVNGTNSGTPLFSTSVSTNLSYTGTPTIEVASTGTGNRTITPGTPSEANTFDFNFISTSAVSYGFSINNNARNITANGSSQSIDLNGLRIFGNFSHITTTGNTTFSSTPTVIFSATSGTKTIDFNGASCAFEPNINGAGGTFQLLSNLTMTGTVNNFILTNGTLDLNGKTLTVAVRFRIDTGTKNITFNGGTIVCPNANTTSWNNTAPTNFTTTAGTGTGKISMTAATAKTFVGGGSTYNCTLSNDGAGALTISGSNTFTTIANGVQPTTFTFTSGTTQTLTNWSVSGTSGNLVTIGATTTSAATLSKSSGTVSADYLSISYSTATGGASWYAGANSTNGGNNTGWIFTAPPVSGNGRFLIFFH